jgi:hypothetical protein
MMVMIAVAVYHEHVWTELWEKLLLLLLLI